MGFKQLLFIQAQEQLKDARQSSSASEYVLNLKEKLRLAESKIRQVKAERDLLLEEFKVSLLLSVQLSNTHADNLDKYEHFFFPPTFFFFIRLARLRLFQMDMGKKSGYSTCRMAFTL